MKLSVAYTFEPGLIEQLAQFPEVSEIYGKLDRDIIGGGRSTYTLRHTTHRMLENAVKCAHAHSIDFNYLINGATLDGTEQTRHGRAAIEKLLGYLDGIGVDALTVASPFLLKMIRKQFPRFKVRVSAFACIDSPEKATQWEGMGADTLCLSAIGCNRNFPMLEAIRRAARCDLQLIVNASCIPNCAHELTHMNLLTQSSRKGHRLKGFCLDYCVLNCTRMRLENPEYFIRSIWIRPEDLIHYENIGYSNFKIVERSCPGDLLVGRVRAYSGRFFKGNLLELVAPVAQVKEELQQSRRRKLVMIVTLARPRYIKISSMLRMKKYAEHVVQHEFGKEKAPIYIDNKKLDGFIEGLRKKDCARTDCGKCAYCRVWMEKVLRIDERYRSEGLAMAAMLEKGLADGSLW